MKLAGLILMGGKNTRMQGQKKAFLKYGEKLFYQHTAACMQSLGNIYLSVEKTEGYEQLGYPLVADEYPEIGPLGGLHSGLKHCAEEALFVLPCDMPKLSEVVVAGMIAGWEQIKTPLILQTRERWYPLVGIYHKSDLGLLEARIASGDFRAAAFARAVGVRLFCFEEKEASEMVKNVNSPEEYNSL